MMRILQFDYEDGDDSNQEDEEADEILQGSAAITAKPPKIPRFSSVRSMNTLIDDDGGKEDDINDADSQKASALMRSMSFGTKNYKYDGGGFLLKQYDLSDNTVIGLLWDMITTRMDTTITVEWTSRAEFRNPKCGRTRWSLDQNGSLKDVDMKGHDYQLLLFGAGRRICPGAQLAINLVMSMLSYLLHHFAKSPASGG
ncbi:hypothetical protein HAX54_044716 [Datura stramonium]|uniref:Cytochrome P450 n=1 Tax=Datura stramonium TaxID=4076 RepID=A0ABS8WIR0_DATST|nr:hypothetical protein [Datura stramonium]